MIGLIGFGRFGELATRYLSEDFEVLVYDSGGRGPAIVQAGGRGVDFETACRQRYLILCVPISSLADFLKRVAPHLGAETTVVDVCSVKRYPVQWMRTILPPHAGILATHPMFGPDSAACSLGGCKIVLCRERIPQRRFQRIGDYLSRKGLQVIETSPDEHDRQIAVSLSLTHFIGRSLAEYGAQDLTIDTEGYQRLMNILDVVQNDTWQLFYDMHTYNPYARQERAAFIEALGKIHTQLDQRPQPATLLDPS
jgi:prephenate dehydrogenase